MRNKKPQKAESVTRGSQNIALQCMYGDVLYTEVCSVMLNIVWWLIHLQDRRQKVLLDFPSEADQTRTDNNIAQQTPSPMM